MRSKVTGARRWVVKIGSARLTADGKGLDRGAMAVWVEQMVALREAGVELVLVSSGAVAAGMGSSVEDDCAGCGDHVVGPGTCLLALTLLVLFWFLHLPRPRSLPPLRRRSGSSVASPRRRPRIRALSFLELSILRT